MIDKTLTIYKTLALKYGATYTYDYSRSQLHIDIKNVRNPMKLLTEMRKIQCLSNGVYL